ncbi:MAG: HAMP domain-containing protein [Anaerolineaceae bacterium]|nr:HAMP domain-containing protein [Anaerolineaceae bacterium]
MTIRQKLLLTILITSVFTTILLYTLSHSILLNGFTRLESEMLFSGTQRVLNTVQQELATLSATTADWAYWDDTFEFLNGQNPSYIADNFTAETLAYLDLNMVLITDSEDRLVYSEFFDSERGFVPSPVQLDSATTAAFIPDSADLQSSVTGIVELDGVLFLVASRHILDSHLNAPIHGTLVFGRYLDESKLDALSETLETDLALSPVNNPDMADVFFTLQQRGERGVLVRPLSATEVASYSLIKDITRKPAYILQVKAPRDIYNYGLKSVRYFVSTLFFVGAGFLIVMLIIIERMIVSRIASLNQSVLALRAGNQDFTVPIEIKGNDEIATFASTFKTLLGEIALSHQALEQTNVELEVRVAQRTQALEQANIALEKEVFERKQAQAKLQQSRDQALEALRLKTQILANVSHDARTPLSVITLYAQMCQAGLYGSLTEKQAEAMETILTNAQKMLTFVNNLLQESQAGAKKKEHLQKVPFKTILLLKDIETMFRPLAVEKKLQLTSSIATDIPGTLYGDIERMKQIINNLVDNAIKFTPTGRVHVAIYSQEPDHLAIAVTDTGIGIALEHRDKIFESFWQVDGTITRDVNRGVGLGLSIVQKLVDMMGGMVSVETNSPAPGTTFKVVLPYEREPETTP